MTVADGLLVALAIIALVPVAVVAIETLASLLPAPRPAQGQLAGDAGMPPDAVRAGSASVVLIPAHNEEAGIAAMLCALQSQLGPRDRALVVADNCTDGTAEAARRCGAEVLERCDADRRGKGFALDRGVRHLEGNPPEIVVVLDADCRLADGALAKLKDEPGRTGNPVQALYLLAAAGESPRRRLSRFAFLFKNLVRPLGLRRLGMPCLLTGTGMAFPWDAIRTAHLASGNIVEDMKLGVDLALAGRCPRFCPDALVEGDGAPNDKAALTQRTRWEHGHIRTMLSQAPRLLIAGSLRCRPKLLALGLELAVPPLALLVAALMALLGVSAATWRFADGSPLPFALALSAIGALALTVLLAWVAHGRKVLPLRALMMAPLYVLWKLPVYARLVRRPERAWVRTERGPV